MLIDGDDDLLHAEPELLRGRFEDTQIGLVGHDPRHVGRLAIGGVERFLHDFRQVRDGMTEDLTTLHAQLADCARRRGAAVDIKQLVIAPVRVHARREHAAILRDALPFRSFEHDGARAIAE